LPAFQAVSFLLHSVKHANFQKMNNDRELLEQMASYPHFNQAEIRLETNKPLNEAI